MYQADAISPTNLQLNTLFERTSPLSDSETLTLGRQFAADAGVSPDFIEAIILSKQSYYTHGRVGATIDGANAALYGPMEVHEGLLKNGQWFESAGLYGPDGRALTAEDLLESEALAIYAGVQHFANLVSQYGGNQVQALNHYMNGDPNNYKHTPALFLPSHYPTVGDDKSDKEKTQSNRLGVNQTTKHHANNQAYGVSAANSTGQVSNLTDTSTTRSGGANEVGSGKSGELDTNFGVVPRYWGDGPAAKKLGAVPGSCFWVNGPESLDSLKRYVDQCKADGTVANIALYHAVNRDNAGGGATNLTDYNKWGQQVSHIVGDTKANIIVEPDTFALAGVTSASDPRYMQLFDALETLQAGNPNATIALDIGHSNWHSAQKVISVLNEKVDGVSLASMTDAISVNVSNHMSDKDCISYINTIREGTGIKYGFVDTSRNQSNNALAKNGGWMDNPYAGLGRTPGLIEGEEGILALWIKPPGEGDDLSTGGAYSERAAQSLIDNSPYDW